MSIFLKIVTNEFKNENRDKRELSVVNTFGVDIIVLAKGDRDFTDCVDGFTVHRRSTRPLKLFKSARINRICSLITWACYARKLKPDCISGHDIIALFIGWLSTWFLPKSRKPKLVYDSHEFEMGRNSDGKRSKPMQFVIIMLERFLMKRCAFSIMVNDSISGEVQKIHRLKQRPVVVRNIPGYWTVDESVCRQRRLEFCRQLGVPSDTFIVMYHGGITPGRGVESLLKAVQKVSGAVAVILGNGEESYVNKLKEMAGELGITERVLFHNAVGINELWQYVGAADAGVSLAANTCLNHYYMLPNKIFENIQSLTPVIGSNFPEIRRLLSDFDIGICVDPENIDEIAGAIDSMRLDKDLCKRFKENLVAAKKQLCWENERTVLMDAYNPVLR